MKTILIVFLLLSFQSYTQDEGEEPVYLEVDKDASFEGGAEQMNLFIVKNLRYPALIAIEEQVSVRVIIEKDGTLSNIRVLKGIPSCSECDEEVIRVVRLMPPFVPATKYGTIVRSYYNFPVSFKL